MLRTILLAALSGLLGLTTGAAAEETPLPEALLQQSIAAHGGREALRDYPNLEMKGTYELSGRMAGRRVDTIRRVRADGAYHQEITFEFRGRKLTPVEFFDGEMRKRRFSSGWDDLPLDEAVEERDHRLPFLLTLSVGEARVEDGGTEGDVAVWRLSVPEGRGEAQLYLAKDDWRMVALEYPGTSAEGMGTKEEVTRKLVFRDHRSVGSLVLPFDIEVLEDGSPQGRQRFDTIEVLDSFDPAWLRVPDPTRRFVPPEELVF